MNNVAIFSVMEIDPTSVNNVVIFSVMETDYPTHLINVALYYLFKLYIVYEAVYVSQSGDLIRDVL